MLRQLLKIDKSQDTKSLPTYALVCCLILLILPQCDFSRSRTYPDDVTINGSIEYQTIQGLGGQMESHNPGYSSQFWDLLFNDIGVSALLLFPFPDHPHLDQEEVFPVLRQAKSYGVQHFYVSFSSPKAEWKDSKNRLLPKYYDDYANYFVWYFNYIKNSTGVAITDMAAFNEPSWYTSDFWRCLISATEYINFLKIAGPIIREGNISVKIHAPNDLDVKHSISYANTILSDPIASDFVDILSSHGYSGSKSSPQYWRTFASIAQAYNKETACTENLHCCGNPGPHPSGIHTAKWIHRAFTDGNAIAFHWWEMLEMGRHRDHRGFVYSKDWPPAKDGPGTEFSTDGITKYGYAFKQFARWVRPGAIRVEANSNDPNILVSAYTHSTNNTFTIVAINDSTTDKTVNFDIKSPKSISGLTAYRTSATENSIDLGKVSVMSSTFTYSLPKKSITTFTGALFNSTLSFLS